MRLVKQVHVRGVTVLLLCCLLRAVTEHATQKKDMKTRQRDGRGQEEGGVTSRGERTKASEARVGVGEQGDKERKGERMKGQILKRTDREKSQIIQDKIYTNTRRAGFWGVLVLF